MASRSSLTRRAPQPTPISPNVPFNLALGIALGLLVGIAAAFVRNARDTRVRSAARLQELTGAPVLSEIASDRDARLHPLTLGAPPGSARVESFRKLRTNLQFLEPTRPHRVVVVTSATVGEGKSTTACNLALALADAGSRVLLIDLNLRLPQVDRYLQVEPGAGVANVLSGRIAVKNAVLRWVDGGLDVLPAGPVPFNPSELLASRATAALLDEVRQRYDYVIIDAPAVLPVTDAAAVAARADGVVLVVRYGRTSEEQVAAAVNGLEAVGVLLLGVALTGTRPSRWRRGRAGSYPEPDPAPPTRGTPVPGGRGHVDGVMPLGAVTVSDRHSHGEHPHGWRAQRQRHERCTAQRGCERHPAQRGCERHPEQRDPGGRHRQPDALAGARICRTRRERAAALTEPARLGRSPQQSRRVKAALPRLIRAHAAGDVL